MRTVRIFVTALGAAVVGLCLGGCLNLKSDYPEKRLFVLEARRPPNMPKRAPVGNILMVRKFSVSQAFERAEFVYRVGKYSYESDFYNAFFASPPAIVAEQTARWLGDSGLFRQATDSATRLPIDYLLEGHIATLCGDLRDSAKPLGVIEIDFRLIDEMTTSTATAPLYRSYREEVPMKSAEVGELAGALSEGLAKILTRLEADIESAAKP